MSRIRTRQYGFILVNYANPDMVGHTGIFSAAVQTIEVLDECLGKVIAAANDAAMTVMITADHGNIETMRDHASGQPHTAHTTDPVPFILVRKRATLKPGGLLADVAPTVLALMGIGQPADMTGSSLVL